MDTVQIIYTLKNIKLFLGVYPSDLLPHSIQQQAGTVIINSDSHTLKGSHWFAIHFQPKASKAYYFYSYGHPPFNSNIQSFLRWNCTVWDYNTAQLQGPSSVVCGKNCCLLALYMDRGFTPKQFVNLFTADMADRQIEQLFTHEIGTLCGNPVADSGAPHRINRKYFYKFIKINFRLVRGASLISIWRIY